MRSDYLPFATPPVGPDEIEEVTDTLESGWLTTGPKTARFESEFQEYLGAPAALGLNSCTAAMHTALMVLGVGPGDEVITSTMTFAATANVIEHVGARPVFVDVLPDTLNLDPAKVREAVTERTRVILPVHYAGHPVRLGEIRRIARRHDLEILEDAAHALPASYGGDRVGSGDNPVAFSFYVTKNLTTGEGGMLTGSPEFVENARVWSLHGMDRDAWKRYEESGSWYYEVTRPGFKYNMTDIQASVGLVQLSKLEQFQRRRTEIVAKYSEAFRNHVALEVPVERSDVTHAWHLYVLRLKQSRLRINRDRFVRELDKRNIGASVHFIPVHMHPYYASKYGFSPDCFPVAAENYGRAVSLPLHPVLTDQDVEDVIGAVLDILDEFG